MASVESKLVTAREFFLMPDMGPCELVRGKVVTMTPPGWRHGNVATRIVQLLGNYLDENDIGRIATLDAGVVTQRDPDTVRGADVYFHSYQRLPEELDPEDYPEIAPEIIWEVLSPNDRRAAVLKKVAEYLEAGVLIVCVVDPKRECFVTYYPDRPEERKVLGDSWSAPEILPGFDLPLEKIFRRRKRNS